MIAMKFLYLLAGIIAGTTKADNTSIGHRQLDWTVGIAGQMAPTAVLEDGANQDGSFKVKFRHGSGHGTVGSYRIMVYASDDMVSDPANSACPSVNPDDIFQDIHIVSTSSGTMKFLADVTPSFGQVIQGQPALTSTVDFFFNADLVTSDAYLADPSDATKALASLCFRMELMGNLGETTGQDPPEVVSFVELGLDITYTLSGALGPIVDYYTTQAYAVQDVAKAVEYTASASTCGSLNVRPGQEACTLICTADYPLAHISGIQALYYQQWDSTLDEGDGLAQNAFLGGAIQQLTRYAEDCKVISGAHCCQIMTVLSHSIFDYVKDTDEVMVAGFALLTPGPGVARKLRIRNTMDRALASPDEQEAPFQTTLQLAPPEESAGSETAGFLALLAGAVGATSLLV